MNPLDIHTVPLSGKVLIEASAGTGKTYTISLVFIRFLIERLLKIDQIVLVTFTDAATTELRERIGAFVRDSLVLWEACEQEKDNLTGDLGALISSLYARKDIDHRQVKQNLRDACIRIDEASIFTIHGFCTRLLNDFSFEIGASLDRELISDPKPFYDRLVYDFWRRSILTLPESLLSTLGKITPESFRMVLSPVIQNPGGVLRYSGDSIETLAQKNEELHRDSLVIWKELQESWLQEKEQFSIIMTELSGVINRNSAGIKGKWKAEERFDESTLYSNIETFLLSPRVQSDCKVIVCLSWDNLVHSSKFVTKKGMSLDREEIFSGFTFPQCVQRYVDIMEEIMGIRTSILSGLAYTFAQSIFADLTEEKERTGVRSFDDLIADMRTAITGPHRMMLQKAVLRRYEVALVDEFQDTDALQFQIFDYLFGSATLFMIGDPKQAIYRFRGGDITAYFGARKGVPTDNCFTLARNFRSERTLIGALNDLFSVDEPFLTTDILYHTVEAATDLLPLTINDVAVKPCVVWGEEKQSKAAFKPLVRRAIVQEIQSLLHNNTMIGSEESRRRLTTGDIAILTDSKADAKQFRKALAEENILAVVMRSDSVFRTKAAEFLLRLLTAFRFSERDDFLHALLIHPFYGKTPADIVNMDPQRREYMQKLVYECQTLWLDSGLLRAVDYYLLKENLWAALVQGVDGDRHCTDMRQLLELLHHEEESLGRIPSRIVRRFVRLRSEDSREHEERLETDDEAVKIMTIHGSKGLQFPVVFVPDVSRGGSTKDKGNTVFVYHEDEQTIVDFGPHETDHAQNRNFQEEREEAARLFYVALTRAEQRLYVAYSRDKTLSPGERILSVQEDATDKSPHILVERIPEERSELLGNEERITRPLPRHKSCTCSITRSWALSSFSGISRKLEHPQSTTVFVPHDERKGIFAFPAGARPGEFLHNIFEKVDFRGTPDDVSALVKRIFLAETEMSLHLNVVVEQVITILQKKMFGTENFALADIERHQHIAELEFWMSAEHIDIAAIRAIMGDRIPPVLEQMNLRGYLNGFIDLLFKKDDRYYILDWKSNLLGTEIDEYDEANMEKAMYDHAYHLQYSLYTVALCRYLKKQDPQFDYASQFGGVYYLFLRGISSDDDCTRGIYSVIPPEEEIQALDTLFGYME